jgi:hypothetical protein
MHFRATDTFTFLFVFLSILSIASPLQVSNSPRTIVDARQTSEIVGEQPSSIHHLHHKCANMIPEIISIVKDVIQSIITDIKNYEKDAHAAESSFTQEMVNSLRKSYPGKNVLVFHDQHSTYNLCTFYLLFYRPFLWLTSFSARRRSCTQGS